MAEALREAYGDLFTIKATPTAGDRALIEGKFRSVHNATTNTAKLMASTFYSLLDLADLSVPRVEAKTEDKPPEAAPAPKTEVPVAPHHRPTIHYNIQIHLPATKDVEVFNAIFRALREHLLE
jgi:hypothetical protein